MQSHEDAQGPEHSTDAASCKKCMRILHGPLLGQVPHGSSAISFEVWGGVVPNIIQDLDGIVAGVATKTLDEGNVSCGEAQICEREGRSQSGKNDDG